MRALRVFLAAIGACGLAGCAGLAETAHLPYVVQPGHIDLARGPDGNTVILDAPDGLIIVDTGRHPEHAQSIIDYARTSGKPVAAIVNTHWHLDHSTGNRDLKLDFPDAEIIATDAARGALTGFLKPSLDRTRAMIADAATPPAERAGAERRLAAVMDEASFFSANPPRQDQTRSIAGRSVNLHVAHAAVTEADLWLVVPDEQLAIVGDLVVAQAPFFDTGCEEGWSAALDAIGAADWDTLIPGHGAPMSRAEFARWRSAFDGFVKCARSGAPSSSCAERWAEDARGFYSAEEGESVRQLIGYYVDQVLRAPAGQRMAYCARPS